MTTEILEAFEKWAIGPTGGFTEEDLKRDRPPYGHLYENDAMNVAWEAFQGALEYTHDKQKLQVWYGSMPESNGKTNWTAILHKGDISAGMTIARSEYPDRVRYEADHVRWLMGELSERPFILDYDADKCSDYSIGLQKSPGVSKCV